MLTYEDIKTIISDAIVAHGYEPAPIDTYRPRGDEIGCSCRLIDYTSEENDGVELCITLRDTPNGEQLARISTWQVEADGELIDMIDDDETDRPNRVRTLAAQLLMGSGAPVRPRVGGGHGPA